MWHPSNLKDQLEAITFLRDEASQPGLRVNHRLRLESVADLVQSMHDELVVLRNKARDKA